MTLQTFLRDATILLGLVIGIYAAWKWEDSWAYFRGKPIKGKRLRKFILTIAIVIFVVIFIAWRFYLPRYSDEPDVFIRWSRSILDVISGL